MCTSGALIGVSDLGLISSSSTGSRKDENLIGASSADDRYVTDYLLSLWGVMERSVYRNLTLKVLVMTIDAQWEGMRDVGSARYEPALLPPCPTIRVLSYSN